MGRECGFVALHATVAAGDVDICLIPEVRVCVRARVCVLVCVCARARARARACG